MDSSFSTNDRSDGLFYRCLSASMDLTHQTTVILLGRKIQPCQDSVSSRRNITVFEFELIFTSTLRDPSRLTGPPATKMSNCLQPSPIGLSACLIFVLMPNCLAQLILLLQYFRCKSNGLFANTLTIVLWHQ